MSAIFDRVGWMCWGAFLWQIGNVLADRWGKPPKKTIRFEELTSEQQIAFRVAFASLHAAFDALRHPGRDAP